MTTLQKIGVVGAGQMGSGIAHVCALAGLDVVLSDVSEDRVTAGIAVIEKNLARQESKGAISANDKAAALARIARATGLGSFGECDLVIEAATENEAVKLDIFREHWEGELFGLRMAVPLGHSTHGSGVAVHPYYFLSFQLAIGGELLLCVLRSLTSTPWIKLWHVVVAALATAVGLVTALQLAES